MDWAELGKWVGNNGPLVAVIGVQWGIIWRLLDRFFAQQDLLMKALQVADRSAGVAEKAVSEKP